jgi:HSP20 family protein
MNVTRWEPFREIEQLFRQYPSVLLSGLTRGGGSEASVWRPVADISETDQEYLVKAELPGINKEDVRIELQDGVLTISGERKVEKEQKAENQLRVERFYGSFSRSFALPDNIDTSKLRAESKDGVLLVHIPKQAASEAQPIKVAVN